jgi:hypothetical protein
VNEQNSVSVMCRVCGRLGVFYLSPEQSRAGALARADRLADYHPHLGQVEVNET